MGDSASKTNCFIYRKPGDGKYVSQLNFISAWTQSGIKQQHPDAVVPEDMNKWGGGKYVCPIFTYSNNPA